jgi:hypothetical protein
MSHLALSKCHTFSFTPFALLHSAQFLGNGLFFFFFFFHYYFRRGSAFGLCCQTSFAAARLWLLLLLEDKVFSYSARRPLDRAWSHGRRWCMAGWLHG